MSNERSSSFNPPSHSLADGDLRDRNTFAIAALRIAFGLLFAVFGQNKAFGTEFVRHGFATYLEEFLRGGQGLLSGAVTFSSNTSGRE
jgi:hypothetical protein